jgi:hypothetical protein
MAYPRLPLDQQQQIIDQFVQAGMPTIDIATFHGIEEGQVLGILRKHEIPTGRKGTRSVADHFSEKQLEEMVEEYNSNVLVKSLLEKYHLSYQQLYAILDQLGVPTRKSTPSRMKGTHDRMQRALQMYFDNYELWKIRSETGIGSPMLYAELHQRGIPMRTKGRSK